MYLYRYSGPIGPTGPPGPTGPSPNFRIYEPKVYHNNFTCDICAKTIHDNDICFASDNSRMKNQHYDCVKCSECQQTTNIMMRTHNKWFCSNCIHPTTDVLVFGSSITRIFRERCCQKCKEVFKENDNYYSDNLDKWYHFECIKCPGCDKLPSKKEELEDEAWACEECGPEPGEFTKTSDTINF